MTSGGESRPAPVAGVRLATAAAGIRKVDRSDLLLMEVAPGAACSAVFTRNAFCAAPVIVAREHLASGAPRYLLVNAGNANAGTGAAGLRDARDCCAAVAARGGCSPAAVLPFSTGVIGEPLPVERIQAALPDLFARLEADAWADAARAIMTTDTVPKAVTRQVTLDGDIMTVTGIAKGAGMIHPDMATMLAFIATDAAVAPDLLDACLAEAVDGSFHCITVDGDTSTNDACVLIATGAAKAPPLASTDDPRYPAFCDAVAHVCRELARAIVRDAEGATKFITIEIAEGRDAGECRAAALAIALSPLVKTAFFASDPNWGRILAALGRAPLPELDVARVSIDLDEVRIVENGARAAGYTESRGAEVMRRGEITVRVRLGRGTAAARVWTSDLSTEYVRINAEYRT